MAIVLIGRKAALAALFWGISLVTQGWLSWIAGSLALLATVWVLGFVVHRYGRSWRRIYFGFMDHYSFMANAHLAVEAMTEGGMAFDQLKPIAASMKRDSPKMNDGEVETWLARWKSEADAFETREFFRDLYAEINPSMNELEVRQAIDDMQNQVLSEEHYNSYLLRYIIGQIIEKDAGIDEKKRYWRAILTGKVV